ncbi:MAG: hypothetical protein Q4F41_13830 [Eubacteriales bacterium]|nr:hypothetical protein [Eubacteriales bacterium]
MKKRYFVLMLLVGALSVNSAAFAEEEEAPKYTAGNAVDLMKEDLLAMAEEASEDVASVRSEMDMGMELEIAITGEEATSMQMNMTMDAQMVNEEIFEPYASHQTSAMNLSIMGQSQSENTETYIREEDGERVRYEGYVVNGEVTDWYRSSYTAGDTDSFFLESRAILEQELFELNPETVLDAEGNEYYVLTGEVNLQEDMEEDGLSADVVDLMEELQDSFGEGSLNLPETVTMELYVSTDDMRLREIAMDLSGIEGSVDEDGMTMEMKFTKLAVNVLLSDYNAVEEIVFPENLDESEEDDWETEYEDETDWFEGTEVSIETELAEETEFIGTDEPAEVTGDQDKQALAEEFGVAGFKDTTDTSVNFTAKGTVSDPAGLFEMGKAYLYNPESDMYEQVGLQVTGVTGGEKAAALVNELLNAEGSYYSFSALRNYEEYRVLNYDLYLPKDLTDSEYGLYSPACMLEVVGADGDWLEYNGQGYYASTYTIYDDDGEYHAGDTVHCQAILIMPADLTEYALQFGPYGLDDLFFVAIHE